MLTATQTAPGCALDETRPKQPLAIAHGLSERQRRSPSGAIPPSYRRPTPSFTECGFRLRAVSGSPRTHNAFPFQSQARAKVIPRTPVPGLTAQRDISVVHTRFSVAYCNHDSTPKLESKRNGRARAVLRLQRRTQSFFLHHGRAWRPLSARHHCRAGRGRPRCLSWLFINKKQWKASRRW